MTPSTRRSALGRPTAVGAGLAGLLIVADFGGSRGTLSPGDAATAHAPIDSASRACDGEREEVIDLRCERCHDPGNMDRLSNASHAPAGERRLAEGRTGAIAGVRDLPHRSPRSHAQ